MDTIRDYLSILSLVGVGIFLLRGLLWIISFFSNVKMINILEKILDVFLWMCFLPICLCMIIAFIFSYIFLEISVIITVIFLYAMLKGLNLVTETPYPKYQVNAMLITICIFLFLNGLMYYLSSTEWKEFTTGWLIICAVIVSIFIFFDIREIFKSTESSVSKHDVKEILQQISILAIILLLLFLISNYLCI